MKKLISLIGAGALLLSVAGSALAEDEPKVKDNWAKVDNSSSAVAVSGDNVQGGLVQVTGRRADVNGSILVSGNNEMETGRARAKASAKVVVNSIVDCDACGEGKVKDNIADVANDAVAEARSGSNGQGGQVLVDRADVGGVTVSGNNLLTTHSARAKSRTFVVVNSVLSD